MRCSRSLAPLALGAAAALLVVPLAGCGGGQANAGKRMPENKRPDQASRKPAVPASWIPGFVAEMSMEEKVGQLFVPTFPDTGSAETMLKRYRVGGVIYFPENTRTPKQTAQLSNRLQQATKIPLLIGVDQENGLVSRLPYITKFPGNMALGATRNPGDVRAAARVTGTELRAVGINQNYAPVADVNVNPGNPVIGIRSYGSDPALVARLLTAALDGFKDAGVAATAKHFPGHGDTGTDSHTGLPIIKHSKTLWERVDAPPFTAAIKHGVDAIMTAHIVVPGLDRSGDPATLSREVLTGLLREKLGYQGVIVTDSLSMVGAQERYGATRAAVRAVQAGADQLLMPPNLPRAYNAVLDAVRANKISKQRLDEAVSRILRLKEARGLFGDIRVDAAKAAAIVASPQHKDEARKIAEHSITLVKNKGGLLPLKAGTKVYVTGSGERALTAALRRRNVRTVDSLRAADVVVLGTLDARASTAAQIRGLGAKKVVVAALGRPYDLAHADRAEAALATYSSSNASLAALAGVLTGAVRPSGKLPVAIGGYSFGHGLSY